MALKNKYAKAEEIPAELKSFYVERDGAWLLDSERNEELRQTNITVMKERDALLKRFEGIDPDAVRQLAAEKARLEEEQRLKDGKFQEVLADRLKAAVSPVAAERDALNGRLSALLIDQAVVTEATKRGLRPTALTDITARKQAEELLKVGGLQSAIFNSAYFSSIGAKGVSGCPVT